MEEGLEGIDGRLGSQLGKQLLETREANRKVHHKGYQESSQNSDF